MKQIIDLTLGLLAGSVIALGMVLVLFITLLVLTPFILYFTTKEILRFIINK